jgi:hypothetical protein
MPPVVRGNSIIRDQRAKRAKDSARVFLNPAQKRRFVVQDDDFNPPIAGTAFCWVVLGSSGWNSANPGHGHPLGVECWLRVRRNRKHRQGPGCGEFPVGGKNALWMGASSVWPSMRKFPLGLL